jgi:hypothetical protein
LQNHRAVDLPGRFHLSDSDGERTTAILALEAYPDSSYLRWLGERVVVESPHPGFLGAQALVTAALRSPRPALPRLLKIVTAAKDRLDRLAKDDKEELASVYNVSARKDTLALAETLIEMRTVERENGMKPDDLDEYLATLLDSFNLASLEKLFAKRLKTQLKYYGRLTDPLELVVVGVVVKGRDSELGPDLIRAAAADKPQNATFVKIMETYASVHVPA